MTTATEIADKLAVEHNLSKAQGKTLIDGVIRANIDAAASGDEISLPGLASSRSRPRPSATAAIHRPARPSRSRPQRSSPSLQPRR